MSTSRRHFLQLSGAALGAAALSASSLAAASDESRSFWKPREVGKAGQKLRLLFLGGTRFIGPHQVEYALARGHEVTLFNRGKSNPQLFPDLEKLRGDRDTAELDALQGRTWDAVVDNSAHVPRWIAEVGELLQGKIGQYLFISSTGVYHPYTEQGIDESGQLALLQDPTVEEVTGDTFGGLKVLCEREAERRFPGATTVIRPHLIVGPGDGSDRFTYWPVRIARGGEVLAPGQPDDPVQIIDVRDLAAFCIHALEANLAGAYNAAGPYSRLTIGGLLHGIRATVSNEISFTWVPSEVLAEHEVAPWSQLPVWIPPEGEYLGMCTIDGSKAVRNGLTLRPLADTARDTLAWWETLPAERRETPRAGCPRELEEKVLTAWHARD